MWARHKHKALSHHRRVERLVGRVPPSVCRLRHSLCIVADTYQRAKRVMRSSHTDNGSGMLGVRGHTELKQRCDNLIHRKKRRYTMQSNAWELNRFAQCAQPHITYTCYCAKRATGTEQPQNLNGVEWSRGGVQPACMGGFFLVHKSSRECLISLERYTGGEGRTVVSAPVTENEQPHKTQRAPLNHHSRRPIALPWTKRASQRNAQIKTWNVGNFDDLTHCLNVCPVLSCPDWD